MVTRNTPTTYYFEGDRASGFEYGLIRAFAREYNMPVRIKVAFSLPELFEMLASGEAHLAAAGLSQSAGRDAHLSHPTPTYISNLSSFISQAHSDPARSMRWRDATSWWSPGASMWKRSLRYSKTSPSSPGARFTPPTRSN